MEFPTKVAYFEGAEDVPGDKEKGVLRLKNGQMAVVYKTDDPHWWLGKVPACVCFSVGRSVRCGLVGRLVVRSVGRSVGRSPYWYRLGSW